ncbi:hypothetical protein F5887DRAFT_943868 [Amanita rubescens]|nr:hypothetical protein F5887DRAFT_943868 [Amanita rubescens]
MSDSRFDRLRTDPRFRKPKKKHSKVVVDDRFKSLFTHKKKRGHVDKYGRAVSETHDEDNLKRFYHLDDGALGAWKPGPDYARGEALLESSDDEGDGDASEDSDQHDEIITIGDDLKTSRDELEVNLDETDFADLDEQALAYSRSHPADDEQNNEEQAQRTNRLAAVNFDWDHVRAIHLYKICSSLVSPTAPLLSTSEVVESKGKGKSSGSAHAIARGRVLNVRIHPSQFGKERMEREEREGPPAEIFKKRKDKDEEVNERNIYDVGDEADCDEDALRNYQLERLRYYYAIITCDTVDAAAHIYSELEGTELERSANVFDLSFVPDDMVFDEEYRYASTSRRLANTNSKALRHSKIKLTWDDDDPERSLVTRRKLTRKEIEDDDFRAFLASSSGSEDERDVQEGNNHKKKAAERDRLRALLLDGAGDQMPEGWAKSGKSLDDVDMEITFTPGLGGKKDEEHETTLEKYQKKMREKKKKRKEERNSKADLEGDDFFAFSSGDETETETREKKAEKVEAAASNTAVSAEELTLLVASDNPNSEPKHFNLKSVIKAEKRAKLKGKKGKKKSKQDDENELQEDFVINVHDDRFKALHDNPQFAIDPNNPRYKKTKSMAALLEERQRRQREFREDVKDTMSIPAVGSDRGLGNLVESVKRKSADLLLDVHIVHCLHRYDIFALEKSSSGCASWNFFSA